MAQQQPLSPHLQIYRLPLTAVLSITHRLTGLVLILGSVLLTATLLALATGSDVYAHARALIDNWAGIVLLIAFTYALYFHFCNGIRHLFWDAGMGYDLETATKSGVFTLIAAAVLTALAWVVGYSVGA